MILLSVFVQSDVATLSQVFEEDEEEYSSEKYWFIHSGCFWACPVVIIQFLSCKCVRLYVCLNIQRTFQSNFPTDHFTRAPKSVNPGVLFRQNTWIGGISGSEVTKCSVGLSSPAGSLLVAHRNSNYYGRKKKMQVMAWNIGFTGWEGKKCCLFFPSTVFEASLTRSSWVWNQKIAEAWNSSHLIRSIVHGLMHTSWKNVHYYFEHYFELIIFLIRQTVWSLLNTLSKGNGPFFMY